MPNSGSKNRKSEKLVRFACRMKYKNPRKALKALQKAEMDDERLERLHSTRALCHLEMKNTEEALKSALRGVDQFHGSYELAVLAMTYMQAGRLDNALTTATESVALNAESLEHIILARVCLRLGLHGRAHNAARMARNICSNYITEITYAKACLEVGNLEEARRSAKSAIQLKSCSASHGIMAEIHACSWSLEKASRTASISLDLCDDLESKKNSLLLIAEIHRLRGDIGDAIEILDELMEYEGEQPYFRSELCRGLCLMNQGEVEESFIFLYIAEDIMRMSPQEVITNDWIILNQGYIHLLQICEDQIGLDNIVLQGYVEDNNNPPNLLGRSKKAEEYLILIHSQDRKEASLRPKTCLMLSGNVL